MKLGRKQRVVPLAAACQVGRFIALVALLLPVLAVACGPRGVDRELPAGGYQGDERVPVANVAEAPATPAPAIPAMQGHTVRFERISVEDGLSQNAVRTIVQDGQGFMWFGTEDGLNRYDGYQFTVYKHDPDDAETVSDNFVSTLYRDRSGELWVGTRSGLDRFDRSSGGFIHYRHDPNDPQSPGGEWIVAIYEDDEGALWVGSDGGLDRFDRTSGTFIHYRHDPGDPTTLSDDEVTVIYGDRNGDLWIGTAGGLNRLDRTTGTFAHYQHDPGDPHSLSDNRVLAILEDRQGVLWIGTEGGGLNRLDRTLQTFTHYRHDPDDVAHSLSHDRVRSILEDSTGRLWVGTQNGLNLFDRDRNQFIHYQRNASDPYGLSGNAIWSMYEDQGGVLWFGTYEGGLSKHNRANEQFTLYQHNPALPNSLSDNMVWSIYQDEGGVLWVGTFNGGLNKLDRATGTFAVYQHDPGDPTSLSSDDVRAIVGDRGGALWVGTSGGLDRFDPRIETFTHYRHDSADPGSLSENRVTVLLQDRSGNLWVGTRTGGLNRLVLNADRTSAAEGLDRATSTFVRYWHDPDNAQSLSNDRVWALYEDRSGMVWVGTLGGVNLWDPASDRFTRYVHDPDDPQSLSNDGVFAFYEDAAGRMWIGTWGGGLERFDRTTQTFTHYTEKDGLANNVIYGIEADAEGCLWLSTNKGLSRFDPRSQIFHNYDVSDGLQDNEFNVGAHFRSESGELFFGGVQGLNAFYPEQVRPNPHAPPIVITSFSKFNEVVRTDLSPDEQIQLSHRDNFIAFEFAALDYDAPERNHYAYKLEGFDTDWVDAGTRRYASYTNLKGGEYVFRVKGSNSDGVWNEEGVAVHIIVIPPFWERWWFRALVALLVAVGVVGGYGLRVKSVEARSRELERLVERRTYEIERRTQELGALYRADEEMLRYMQLDRVLQTLVDVAVEILHADKGSLMVWDDEKERLVVRAARGFGPGTMAQMSFAPGQGAVGRVAISGEAIVVEDASTDPRVDRRITEPEGIRSFMHVPIEIGGQIFGVFNVDYIQPRAFGDDEQRLFAALAQRAALAIQNAQLHQQAQELAVVGERQRLARDLHDAVTQTLFSASLIAEVLPRIWERDAQEGQERLEEVRELTRGALAEMRTLLLELRPASLMEAELGDLLRQLGEAITGRARVPVLVEVDGGCSSIPPDVKVALYRIAQEALNNVAKHAAASRATVSLQCITLAPTDGPRLAPSLGEVRESGQRIELCIRDDGRGFDLANVPPDHLGLGIMRERAETIGAKLEIRSEIGCGTEVRVVWSMEGRR